MEDSDVPIKQEEEEEDDKGKLGAVNTECSQKDEEQEEDFSR